MNNNYLKYKENHVHITSSNKLFDLRLKEVWRYRDLIKMFVKKDFALIYKQTILGPLWIFLNPFITTIIYTIVFGEIASLSTNGTPKILFYMTGNALWSFFAASINHTANTFKENANIFGKVYFPRLTKPISTIITAGIDFFIQLGMVSVFLIYFLIQEQISPNWEYFMFLPFLLLFAGMMGLGCGIIVSSLTTKYRDLSILVTFGVSLWMYATPVVYPLSIASNDFMKTVLLLNPLSEIMEMFRFIVLGEGEIFISGIVWSIIFTLFVLILGIILFNKIEKNFIDTI